MCVSIKRPHIDLQRKRDSRASLAISSGDSQLTIVQTRVLLTVAGMVLVGEGDGGEGVGGECALGGEGQKEGKGYIEKDMNARKKVGTRRSRRGHDREIDPPLS